MDKEVFIKGLKQKSLESREEWEGAMHHSKKKNNNYYLYKKGQKIMNKKDYLETRKNLVLREIKLLEKEISNITSLLALEIEKENFKDPSWIPNRTPNTEDTSLPAFIQSCVEISPNASTSKEILYAAYLKFCFHNGIKRILKRQTFCKSFFNYFVSVGENVYPNRITTVETGKKRFRVFKGVTLKSTTTN